MSTFEPDLRPPRFTTVLHLPVPGDADPADAHETIGNLADAIDALAAAGFLRWHPGDLKLSAATGAPDGWLICDGRLVGRAVYAELFQAIGVRYSGGDGSTTFGLPDYRDRVPAMAGPTLGGLGASGGAHRVLLLPNESGVNPNGGTGWQSNDHSHHVAGDTGPDGPDHDHGIGGWETGTNAQNGAGLVVSNMGAPAWVWRSTGASARHAHGFAAWSGGVSANHSHAFNARNADATHENWPPWLACNVLIKT